MSPITAPQPRSAREPAATSAVPPRRTLAGTSNARRRRTLLQLAERHGEVRVALRDAAGPSPTACTVVELLDELNGAGLLRYGGLQRAGATLEIVYRPA